MPTVQNAESRTQLGQMIIPADVTGFIIGWVPGKTHVPS